jgi:2-polyprenyl-3-methyl-5-hydroxy-6-metoxy-1,4-benzoquinol methylase
MRVDIERMRENFSALQAGKRSAHTPMARTRPSRFQYDYLTLSRLARDVERLVREVPAGRAGARALDLGSDRSPYRELLAGRGFDVKTLDITRESGADYEGTIESTGLPDASFDLVLCTQVIEHCMNPWQGMQEVRRILRPGGHAIVSAPHVWFYHPHPTDHWRFTQEGMVHLAREAGLEPVTLLAQGGSVLTVMQVLNFLAYGILGKAGAPLYFALNAAASVGDRLVRNDLFCHNFAVLARRPADAAA